MLPVKSDLVFNESCLKIPVRQFTNNTTVSGFSVIVQNKKESMIFNRLYRLSPPVACCMLFESNGSLWMSDVPQERMMMFCNALNSSGNILVGGLGIGLYIQYLDYLNRINKIKVITVTVVEKSEDVIELVEPMLRDNLSFNLIIYNNTIENYFHKNGTLTNKFDTVFLDTWETLDPVHLNKINELYRAAREFIHSKGAILLWGYYWIYGLYMDGCKKILSMKHREAIHLLQKLKCMQPKKYKVLAVLDNILGDRKPVDLGSGLHHCDDFITNI